METSAAPRVEDQRVVVRVTSAHPETESTSTPFSWPASQGCTWHPLQDRCVLRLTGSQIGVMLQGLVTQDVGSLFTEVMAAGGRAVGEQRVLFAALLNPQGRFVADLFCVRLDAHTGLIDCHRDHKDVLMSLLTQMGAFHAVVCQDESAMYGVCAALGPVVDAVMPACALSGWILGRDPRHGALGWRVWMPFTQWHTLASPVLIPSSWEAYHVHRIQMGVPEGARDLVAGQSVILEYGYHHIQGISWTKGCYMGQELMARTFHRGAVRKGLFRLQLQEGCFPPVGTLLFLGNEKAGIMGGHQGAHGLACLYKDVFPGNDSCDVALKWSTQATAL